MMTIPEILQKYKTIAVVGLSSSPYRASHGVCRYMQANGYRIIPVNPHESEVLGETAYSSLDDTRPSRSRRHLSPARYVADIVEAAIRKGAKVIWMQESVIHEAAADRARQAGLEVVMDRCILKEHMAM